eukprot:12896525-Prorocentrum_lima.AAC.1
MAKDFGWHPCAEVHADATAGIGIARRCGVGDVCHLHLQALWCQQVVCERRIAIFKVKGEPADLPTKHGPKQMMMAHLTKMGFE